MEKLKLVDKLKEKANISYKDAKDALENNNWDILDAIVYLENTGKIRKPTNSVFYTNEYKETYNDKNEVTNIYKNKNENKYKSRNNFEGIFESVCKYIDTCNNIFFEIIREKRTILRVPLTVVIVLLFFTFWIVIPLMIIGLFFDIEFYISSIKVNTEKVNKIFSEISRNVKRIKEELRKRFKNG